MRYIDGPADKFFNKQGFDWEIKWIDLNSNWYQDAAHMSSVKSAILNRYIKKAHADLAVDLERQRKNKLKETT